MRKNKPVKTCDTCINRANCDAFFSRRYDQLGIKEPEGFRNMRCKAHNSPRRIKKINKMIGGVER